MWSIALHLLLIAYLPGAIILRLPIADRARRASLPAEERAYWAVMISVIVSTTFALLLAWSDAYTLDRLIVCNVTVAVLLTVAAAGNLRFGSAALKPGLTALIPVCLIAVGVWMYFAVPPAEYVLGGRDPGVYMNEGIQIAQRQSLIVSDPVAKEVTPAARNVFFPQYDEPFYYSLRFMGFFVTDPDAGSIVGQFPHGYPTWIAIGYGIDGLSGTRRVVSWWAILGVLAVYFASAHLIGRGPAAAAAALLAVSVIQTWHARYPNAEILTQALLFAGLHAHARAHADADRFFGVVSASLLGLAIFVRLPAILAAGAAGLASMLAPAAGQRSRLGFVVTIAGWLVAAGVYYSTVLAPYLGRPFLYLVFLQPVHVAMLSAGLLGIVVLLISVRRPQVAAVVRTGLPVSLIAAVVVGATYAYFFREASGRLAPHDAYALKTFAHLYLTGAGLALAVIGYGLVVWRSFWQSPALVMAFTTFAFFFFYKLRIFPEQFWTTRRFLDMILPAALLFASAAALWPLSRVFTWPWASAQRVAFARTAVGVAVIVLLARHYVIAAGPLRKHIEYANVIPQLERLASRFGNNDLVLVESRFVSDLHTMALPLADIYARNVLVVHSPRPDKAEFSAFLASARQRYDKVYFIGAGGTDLLGPGIAAEPIASVRFEVPEYETTRHDVYPQTSRMKPFAFTIYRFVDAAAGTGPFSIDIGAADDLQLVGFHAKERTNEGEVTFRWTHDQSYISVPRFEADSRELVLRLSNGGRPDGTAPARVTVFFDGREIGTAEPTREFSDYVFPLGDDLAAKLGTRGTAAEIRIQSTTWVPGEVLGGRDSRRLGVIIDRAEIR